MVSDAPQPDCAWPTNAVDKKTCVSLAYLVDDPKPPKSLHVRVVGNLVLNDGSAALSAVDAPGVAVHFDTPQACAGNDLEAIEGEIAGMASPDAPTLEAAMHADGPSLAIVHAKVIGPPASACSAIQPRSALKLPAAFDRGAVSHALSAVKTDDCLPHTAHEAVHIKITFLPGGSVGNVDVDTQLSGGTRVERCVKKHFLKVKVPAFGGGPITVGKSLVLGP